VTEVVSQVWPPDGSTYSETIDQAHGAIRARGRLDRVSVDLLRGTIEQLHRRGHREIAVTIERPASVDPCARAELAEVADRLARCHGRLTVVWAHDGRDPGRTTGSSTSLHGDPARKG
jgi:hypothetical protein